MFSVSVLTGLLQKPQGRAAVALCSPQFACLLQNHRNCLFTSVCWPVPETTGTLWSPQFAGLLHLQKPLELSVHLSLLACSKNHRNALFTSVCWPVTETTGPSVHLCLLACYRSHRALCSPLVCWPVAEATGTLCSPVCWPVTETTGPSVQLCWPVAEATGPFVQLCLLACCRSHRALCSALFAGLLQKPQGPLFTSVCWPIAETTGEGGSGQQLKEHLVDELDYMLVPAEAWNKLVAWYTLMPGQVCSRQQNGCSLCG